MGYKGYRGYIPAKYPKKPRGDSASRKLARELEAKRTCTTRCEGDEFVCHCGLRWPIAEARPQCGGENRSN